MALNPVPRREAFPREWEIWDDILKKQLKHGNEKQKQPPEKY